MSEAVVQVAEVKEGATGQSSRGKWTRYDLIDGNGERYATFSKSLYDLAKPYEGLKAQIEYEEEEKGFKLTAISEVSQNGGTPSLGTGEYVKGQTAPADARRMLACRAWEHGTELAIELLRHQTGREITPELVRATADAMVQHVWMDLLRKGRCMEDEDIPFG